MLKVESAENTPSAFQKERSNSTHWQYSIPSVFPAYPVSALELQQNTHWCLLYGLKAKLSSKKDPVQGTDSLEITKLFKKNSAD